MAKVVDAKEEFLQSVDSVCWFESNLLRYRGLKNCVEVVEMVYMKIDSLFVGSNPTLYVCGNAYPSSK